MVYYKTAWNTNIACYSSLKTCWNSQILYDFSILIMDTAWNLLVVNCHWPLTAYFQYIQKCLSNTTLREWHCNRLNVVNRMTTIYLNYWQFIEYIKKYMLNKNLTEYHYSMKSDKCWAQQLTLEIVLMPFTELTGF